MTIPTDPTWRFYGKHAPYFAVFGQEEYLDINLDDKRLEEFFTSGEAYVAELFDVIRQKIDPAFKPVSILDFGCGPGRMIIPFSKHAKAVTGMDISGEMLDIAQQNCLKKNVQNVLFLLSDDDLSGIKDQKFDLVHSFIVLQHLDVKRGEKVFIKLLDKVNEQGIGIIHLLYDDHYPGRKALNFLRFRLPYFANAARIFRKDPVKKHLRNRPQMQMNSYDLNRIFSILQGQGITDVFSSFTDHHDYWGVILYFRK